MNDHSPEYLESLIAEHQREVARLDRLVLEAVEAKRVLMERGENFQAISLAYGGIHLMPHGNKALLEVDAYTERLRRELRARKARVENVQHELANVRAREALDEDARADRRDAALAGGNPA